MTSFPSAPPAAAARPPRDIARRPDRDDDRRRGDDFERLLRAKAASREDLVGEEDAASRGDATAPAPDRAPPGTPWPFAAKLHEWRAASGVPGEASATAAKAAQAGSDTPPDAAKALSGLRADVPGTWEVSINDPRGVGLDLRAQRGEAARPAGPAAWSLTIACGVVDASVLARHAPRLNERLQVRASAHTHVRIADADDRADDHGKDHR